MLSPLSFWLKAQWLIPMVYFGCSLTPLQAQKFPIHPTWQFGVEASLEATHFRQSNALVSYRAPLTAGYRAGFYVQHQFSAHLGGRSGLLYAYRKTWVRGDRHQFLYQHMHFLHLPVMLVYTPSNRFDLGIGTALHILTAHTFQVWTIPPLQVAIRAAIGFRCTPRLRVALSYSHSLVSIEPPYQ